MKNLYVTLLAIGVGLWFPPNLFAEEYLLLGVVDGDTILVYKDKRAEKIDLAGIDAPEMGQDYGFEAWRLLKSKLTGEYVTIENLRAGMGDIVLPGNISAAIYMASEGFAWCDKNYDRNTSSLNNNYYCQIENKAKNDKKGLWAGKKVEVTTIIQQPQSPQEWRAKNSNDLGFDIPEAGSRLTEEEKEKLYKAQELKRLRERLK